MVTPKWDYERNKAASEYFWDRTFSQSEGLKRCSNNQKCKAVLENLFLLGYKLQESPLENCSTCTSYAIDSDWLPFHNQGEW